jgi:microsomal epoxide hydrolase
MRELGRRPCRTGVGRCITIGLVVGAVASTCFAAEGRFTTSDHAEIRYLSEGRQGADRSLLLVPGWTFTADLWRPVIDAFSPTLRVIAIDPRSQGASSKTASGNTPERRAQDLHELAASLGLRDVVLVGWSQGAQDVAAYLAQFGTERLAAVVLVDSPVAAGPAEVSLRPQFVQQVLGGIGVYQAHPREYIEGMLHAILQRPLPPGELERLRDTSLRTPTDVGSAMLVADMLAVDRRPALARCDRPALVVATASSPLLDAQRETAAALHARLETVADAGHAVFVDQPARFVAILRVFVDGLPASARP